MQREKLIRDKLVSVIDRSRLRKATQEERKQLLVYKLIEEVQELAASDYTDQWEFADVLEVLFELGLIAGYSRDQLLGAQDMKYEEKGGFYRGIVLKLEDSDEN